MKFWIAVEVTGGTARTVTQALRLDNGEPGVVEIVSDGPMPMGETKQVTFDADQRTNVVEYTLATVFAGEFRSPRLWNEVLNMMNGTCGTDLM